MAALEETDVVTCFLRSGGEVLLLQRSSEVSSYPGVWGAVAGHAEGDPAEAARREIAEETGIEDAVLVRRGEPFAVEDGELGKRWIVHPYLFETGTRDVRLNWETTTYEWTAPTEILKRPVVPELWRSYRAIAPSLESVRNDREHGSAYVSLRALEVLRDAAAEGAAWDELRTIAASLLDARRSMAVVGNRINRVMHSCAARTKGKSSDSPGEDASIADLVEHSAHGAVRDAIENDRRASAHASELVAGKTVLTLSRSGTVSSALLRAAPQVLVLASQPGAEGVDTAAELAGDGLDVTLIPDAGAASVSAFDLAIVGADTILPNGDVINKLGTHVVGLVAADRGVPLFVVSSVDKILPEGDVEIEEAHWETPVSVPSWAPLFDRTPARLIAGYVTETGVVDRTGIASVAEQLRVLFEW